MKKWQEHEMMLNSLFANSAFKYQKIWSPKFGQKLSIKRDKINLFDLYAMRLL